MIEAGVWDDDARYGCMLLVAILFYVGVALDAVLRENKFELFSFLIVNLLVFFFVVYQFATQYFGAGQPPISTVKWVRCGVVVVVVVGRFDHHRTATRFIMVLLFGPTNVVLCVVDYRNFGWILYRQLGGRFLALQRRTHWRDACVCVCLLCVWPQPRPRFKSCICTTSGSSPA